MIFPPTAILDLAERLSAKADNVNLTTPFFGPCVHSLHWIDPTSWLNPLVFLSHGWHRTTNPQQVARVSPCAIRISGLSRARSLRRPSWPMSPDGLASLSREHGPRSVSRLSAYYGPRGGHTRHPSGSHTNRRPAFLTTTTQCLRPRLSAKERLEGHIQIDRVTTNWYYHSVAFGDCPYRPVSCISPPPKGPRHRQHEPGPSMPAPC